MITKEVQFYLGLCKYRKLFLKIFCCFMLTTDIRMKILYMSLKKMKISVLVLYIFKQIITACPKSL